MRPARTSHCISSCTMTGRITPPAHEVGAHAGFFSMHARNTYPDAIIHAYEPNPNMKQFLEHQSGIGGFTYFLEAVGNKNDMVLLDIDGKESVHTRCRQGGDIPQVAFRTCILR